MKKYKKCRDFALIAGVAMLFGSCVSVQRHPRPPYRPHPHPRKVVIIAGQPAAAGQNGNCAVFEECLAMSETDSYGCTE